MEDNMWILFALMGTGLSAVVASQKARNVAAWAVFGFCFPLIAVIAVFGVKSLQPATAMPPPSSPTPMA